MILEQQCVPLAVRRIHDAALCNAAVPVSKVCTKNVSTCPWAFNIICNITALGTHLALWHVNHKVIISAVYFIQVASFITKTNLFSVILNYNLIYSAFFRTT